MDQNRCHDGIGGFLFENFVAEIRHTTVSPCEGAVGENTDGSGGGSDLVVCRGEE